jgi:hypothetical protein
MNTFTMTEYTVSDEASCLALPPGSGSLSWEDPSNICEIDFDTWTIAAGDTLTISSGVTLLIADGGTINNGGNINNNGGTISGNPVVNEPCNLVERPKVPQPKDLIPCLPPPACFI